MHEIFFQHAMTNGNRYSLAETFDELNRLYEADDDDAVIKRVSNWNSYNDGENKAIKKYLALTGVPKLNGPDSAAIAINLCLARFVELPSVPGKVRDMLLKAIKDASAAVGQRKLTLELLDALRKALDSWLAEMEKYKDKFQYIDQASIDDCEYYMQSFRASVEFAHKVDDEYKFIFPAVFERHTFLAPNSHIMKKLNKV